MDDTVYDTYNWFVREDSPELRARWAPVNAALAGVCASTALAAEDAFAHDHLVRALASCREQVLNFTEFPAGISPAGIRFSAVSTRKFE